MKTVPCLLSICLLFALVACNLPVTDPTATSTTVPTATKMVPTITLPPPTATPKPTRPLPTPLPPVAAELNAMGPWGLLRAGDGLWALNPDGSGITRLTEDTVEVLAPAPDGATLAYVATIPGTMYGLELKLLTLPDGEPRTLTRLDVPLPANPTDEQDQAAREAYSAVVWENSLAWSPDGSYLAFAGGQDGVSSDVYVYSVAEDKITRLTDGPAHAYNLLWSPDGKVILHAGVETFGTGAGYVMEGIWIVTPAGLVTTLYAPPQDSQAEELLEWTDDHTFLVNSWDNVCGRRNLRLYNIQTRQTQILWASYFEDVAYNPYQNAALVNINQYMANCPGNPQAGTYIVRPDGTQQMISMEYPYAPRPEMTADGWYAHNLALGHGLVFINPLTGIEVLEDRPPMNASYVDLSPDRKFRAAFPYGEAGKGIWLSSQAVAPFVVEPDSVNFSGWSPDSRCLFYTLAAYSDMIQPRPLYVSCEPRFSRVVVSEQYAPPYGDLRIVWTP